MKIFLVQAEIEQTPYMEKTTKLKDIRIVLADSVDDAETKFKQYWNSQESKYSVNYWVNHVTITQALE